MNSLLEKARAGRTNALAVKASNLGRTISIYDTSEQFQSQRKIAPVAPIAFISRRAPQNSSSVWLH